MANVLAPGWYYDPAGSGRQRWWDGEHWTDRYQKSRGNTTSTSQTRMRPRPRPPAPPQAPAPPVVLTEEQLGRYANSLRHPLYWMGPHDDFTYELTTNAQHEVYIRYLPPEVMAGDPKIVNTTIGTYPTENAYTIVQTRVAKGELRAHELDDDGLAAWNPNRPNSVYLVRPRSPIIIEVYDPDPERAHEIALSGNIRVI